MPVQREVMPVVLHFSDCLSCVGKDEFGTFPANHHGGGIEIARENGREGRGVDHTQAFQAVDFQGRRDN